MNILYLDDELDILELAHMFFSENGVDIDITTSPFQALEMVMKKNYDIVLSDARMPEMNGLEFFSKLKNELGFKGYFVLVSGHYDHQGDGKTPLGISEIVMKPVDFDHLYQILLNL